jgi:hypothetical protein
MASARGPGRPRSSVGSKPLNLKINIVAYEYLEALVRSGNFGNHWTHVAQRFIGEGIERAIKDDVIHRRKRETPYPIEGAESDSLGAK